MSTGLGAAMNRARVPYRAGVSWTIDTPYRETVAEARRYQAEGVLCVEMEAAALFAVAKVRALQVASAFTISDSLADLVWNPLEFHGPPVHHQPHHAVRVGSERPASNEGGRMSQDDFPTRRAALC